MKFIEILEQGKDYCVAKSEDGVLYKIHTELTSELNSGKLVFKIVDGEIITWYETEVESI